MANCPKRRRFTLLRQLCRPQAARAVIGMESLEPRAMLATLYWDPNGASPSCVRSRHRLDEFGVSSTCDIFSANRLE